MSDQQLLQVTQRIGKLLYRRMNNSLSKQEAEELTEWIDEQDPLKREYLNEITEWEEVHMALSAMYEFDTHSALADVQKKIEGEKLSAAAVLDTVERRRYIRISYKWFAVAAVVFISVGTLIFTLHRKSESIQNIGSITERFKNDIVPGGNKAILELSNGKRIILDSVSKGELANQAGVKVIKLDDDQLAYDKKSGGEGDYVGSNSVTTPNGGQYQIVLSDGSKVWLNAMSRLKFPVRFGKDARSVELYGEAFFQISKDAARPFTVNVLKSNSNSGSAIEVLGTEFNINAYEDESYQKMTLVSGSVRVKSSGRDIVLAEGQQARIKNTDLADFRSSNSVDIDEVIAWKNGQFQFHDASIKDIMRQASRWYDVEVVYHDHVDQLFNGTVPRRVNISTLLKILESTGWVHFAIEGKKVTVFR